MRRDGRRFDELRPIKITRNYITTAEEGSVLIEVGNTRVICTATIEDKVPQFLKDKGQGWVTAEYSLLPRSTQVRVQREAAKGRLGGRTHEIQRMIGRSLRSVVHLETLGERTIWLDCDVIQADGGTRTAAITGAFICLANAIKYALDRGMIIKSPLKDSLAAISVGIVEGQPMLDLCYDEDFAAEVDMNVVMTGSGKFVEIQGTAELVPFERKTLDQLLDIASSGIEMITEVQRAQIEEGVLKLK